MKYCNVCKKDVEPVRGKCPDCGFNFNVKVKKDAVPIEINRLKKAKEDTNRSIMISGFCRFLALIIIFFGFALWLTGSGFIIALLMFLISFLLFSISELYDKLEDMVIEIDKLKKKVKTKKK